MYRTPSTACAFLVLALTTTGRGDNGVTAQRADGEACTYACVESCPTLETQEATCQALATGCHRDLCIVGGEPGCANEVRCYIQ